MGATGLFTIGRRYKHMKSDTMKTTRHIPYTDYQSIDELVLPEDCQLIGVELVDSAENLMQFEHPERAIYLLGAEDEGLPQEILERCHKIIQIPFDKNSLNVSVAGSIIMYDRRLKESK